MDKTPLLECANKVPTPTTPTRVRNPKLKLLTITALIVALSGAATAVAITQAPETVHLTVDGAPRVIETTAPTVEAALEEESIEVDSFTTVAPALSTPVSDGLAVAVLYAKPVKVISDGSPVQANLTAVTVDDALSALTLDPEKGAYVSEDLDDRIPRDGIELVVSNPKPLTLIAKGKKKTVETPAVTVGAFLKEQGVSVDEDDKLSQRLGTYTKPRLTVEVVDIEVKKKKERVVNSLPVEYRTDPNLLEGKTRVAKPGAPRVVERTVRLTFADNELSKRDLLRQQVVSRGAPRVILKGTKEPAPVLPAVSPGSARALGQRLMLAAGFSADQWSCLDALWTKESGWNPRADNPTSSAYGIPQALTDTHGLNGTAYMHSPAVQIKWGLDYIRGAYGTPCSAWGHSQSVGWY